METFYIILAFVFAFMIFVIYAQSKRIISLETQFKTEKDTKMSMAVKHGMTMEHLIPWAKDFPGDARAFRFIGDPIDGVLFAKDKIVFMEFKTGNSQLSEKQKQIKELVKQKRIEWNEVRT